MLKVFIRLAWRNIFLHRRKSLLAVLAVAACCFSLNIFQGYIRGAEVIFQDTYSERTMAGDLLVRKAGLHHVLSSEPEDFLDSKEQAFLDSYLMADPETDVFMRHLRVNGTISNGDAQSVFSGLAYDVEKGTKMRSPVWTWNALAGKPLISDQEETLHLGQSLAFLLGCVPEHEGRFITGQGGYDPKERPFRCRDKQMQLSGVTLNGQANALSLEVSGLVDAMFREVDLRYVNMPLKVGQRLIDTDRVSFYTVRLKPGSDETAFLARLQAAGRNAGFAIAARSWKDDEVGDFYRRTMDFLHVFRTFMIVVILGVALLSVFNTFYRNVQERIREIGVLRTLGFKLSQVRQLFLLETLFLALMGIALGGGAALTISVVINRISILYKIGLLTQPVPFLVVQNEFTLAWTLFVALLVALLAAALPLYAVGKRRISEALTHT